jgi:hypothetical protein
VAVLENLEKTQNISLDELRTNHNALVTAMSMRSVSTLDTGSGMLFTAELLLVLAGVMEMWSPWLGLLWVCFLFVTWQGKLETGPCNQNQTQSVLHSFILSDQE